MPKSLDPDRLKELRSRKKLSQEDLAEKAGLSKETVHRVEKGRQPGNRQRTLNGLAKALSVEPRVLTCEAPMPEVGASGHEALDSGRYQMNVRIDGAVRNAFSLAVLRYRVPMTRIIELAPFLFVLAAEASLERRRARLAELESLFHQEEALRGNFPHLSPKVVPHYMADDALLAEKDSIDARDILAVELLDDIDNNVSPINDDYDEGAHNPFVRYLQEFSSAYVDAASIKRFDRYWVRFSVCGDDALKFVNGDKELLNGIIDGGVMLHEMPRDLLDKDAAEARIAWLRQALNAYRVEQRELGDSLKELLGEEPTP